MPLAHLVHFNQFRPPLSASLRPKIAASRDIPARDRAIDFGKHKGRMLGSLPSSYLKWVSKNLRARDLEEWARLADEVLEDPVYRDRLEWEAAERVLAGDGAVGRGSETPVSDLIDVSERFGWDNEDKDAWALINFELLGTSKGGRIPRLQRPGKVANGETLSADSQISSHLSLASSIRSPGSRKGRKDRFLGVNVASSSNLKLRSVGSSKEETFGGDSKNMDNESIWSGRKVGFLSKGHRYIVGEEAREEGEEMEVVTKSHREERRERRRLWREQQMEMLKREVGLEEKNGRNGEISVEKKGLVAGSGESVNPFPGRKVLLDKIKKRGG